MKYDWTTFEAWGRTGAALGASTALTVAFWIVCGTGLPGGTDLGLALGVLGGFVVWVGAACYAVLARTVRRAWLVLGGAAFVLAAWAALAHSFA